MRVVFDTNVIVSAFGWSGPPRSCLDLARDGRVDAYTCLEILGEVAEVLERKLSLPPDTVVEVVEELLGFLRVVPITGSTHAVEEDRDDDKVIECAVVAGASHIVSGDRHLLRLEKFRGIRIQTPAAFLDGVSAVTSTNPS